MARQMKDLASAFHSHSLKFLMYRDWASFEVFLTEMAKCDSLPGLVEISHRFDIFLRTLLREVEKRSVLQEGLTRSGKGQSDESEPHAVM